LELIELCNISILFLVKKKIGEQKFVTNQSFVVVLVVVDDVHVQKTSNVHKDKIERQNVETSF